MAGDARHRPRAALARGSSDDASVQEMRRNLIDCVAELNRYPTTSGLVLHSGSEANEIALYLAREKTGRTSILTTNLAHLSIASAARKLGLEIHLVDVDPRTLEPRSEDLDKVVQGSGDNLAAVVATFGTTQLGTQERFATHPAVQGTLENGAMLHIDGAYGSMILPLLGQYPSQISGGKPFTLTTNPSKFIGVLGCGVLLHPKGLEEVLEKDVPYFRGLPTATLGTTRSAYPAAVALAAIQQEGMSGLRDMADLCLYRAREIAKVVLNFGLGPLAPVSSGVIPLGLRSTPEVEFMVRELHERGYEVSPLRIREKGEGRKWSGGSHFDLHGIRAVITPRPEMNEENIKGFCDALAASYQKMKAHPPI